MAPSVSLLSILFTIGFLSEPSSELELGVHFLDEPGDVIGIKGKSLSIPCRTKTARHMDPFQIVWYHDNRLMNFLTDERRTVLKNGTLYFSKLVHKKTGNSDQGEYRCVAIGKNGSLSSKPGYLKISALPETFFHNPTDQSVLVGSNVKFVCNTAYESNVVIDWEKDQVKIWPNSKKYALISGPYMHGSVLYVFNVTLDDSGSYRCNAKNVLTNKQRHSSSGLLTIVASNDVHKTTDLPSFTFLSAQRSSSRLSTSLREVKEGENITLDCVANNYSYPILGWTFTQRRQNTTRSLYNLTNFGYDMISLKKVSRNQAGLYICTALDLSDKTEKRLEIELRVTFSPEIQEKSDSLIFRTSKTVRFRCIVLGNPIPEVYWLKDGNLFNITGRIKYRTTFNESLQIRQSELIVSSTVASDAGLYQCMAKNSVGSSWAASRLLLNASKPAPGAPERVSCEPISATQIKLTWDVSNSTEEIKAFSIHYHLTDHGEEMQKVMSSDSRSTQIDKLLPFSNYTFYLRLYMESASEFSQKAICQTGEEVPIDAPPKKLHIITRNSVHVSWIPLKKEKARGAIIKYKIQWRSTKSPSSRVVELAGKVLNYTITGLIPGKKYDVRILAATSQGYPQIDMPWETFEIPTNFNSNIPSPPKIILQAINSSVIEVKWKSPNRGTKVIGYKIFYRKQNSSQVGPIIVSADTNKYVVAGLEPETWYEIMVLGFTQENDGESSVSFMHTLSNLGTPFKPPTDFPTFPEPPVTLEADPVSPDTINLTWSIPPALIGLNRIKHYTVCFNPVQSSHIKSLGVTCMKSKENKISVAGLHPFTVYEFKVRTHDANDQESAFSQVMECQTLEGVPSQVNDINWKVINRTMVHIFWKEPRHINGILKNYTIFYTDNSNLPLESWNTKSVSGVTRETQITDLISNVKYYLIIRASTNAGLGLYTSPKQIFISLKSVNRNKSTDHYLGIIMGLGIGIFCIIICTTCILCRRKCLKRQISQEFDVQSYAQSNISSCQRDRGFFSESRETEYFTYLPPQREQPDSLEITLRHLDTKGNCSNGAMNGNKTNFLAESKISSDNLGKTQIYLNDNLKLNNQGNMNKGNLLESAIFNYKNHSLSQQGNESNNSSFSKNYHNESSTPLLTERQKRSVSAASSGSENYDSESEKYSKVKLTSFCSNGMKPISDQTREQIFDSKVEMRIERNDRQHLNKVLENPKFRFSNLSNDLINRNCGYERQSFIYNGFNSKRNEFQDYGM